MAKIYSRWILAVGGAVALAVPLAVAQPIDLRPLMDYDRLAPSAGVILPQKKEKPQPPATEEAQPAEQVEPAAAEAAPSGSADVAPAAEPAPEAVPEVVTPSEEVPASEPTPAAEPATANEPAPTAEAPAEPAPAAAPVAEEETAPVVSMPEMVPALAPTEVPAATEAPATEPTPAAAPAPAPEAAPEVQKKYVAPSDDSVAIPLGQIPARPTMNEKGELMVTVSASEDGATLRFPFAERVAFSVFVRSRTLWIVFNNTIPLDLSEFDNLTATVIGAPTRSVVGGATVLRIPVETNVYTSVLREDGSSGWTIQLLPNRRPLANALSVSVNTEPPAPPNVAIVAYEMADPITLTDPSVGDRLVVVPLYTPGYGMLTRRGFVEFTLLPTAQGIAVLEKADGMLVTPLRNGVRVSMPDGATLSEGIPDLEAEKSLGALINSATYFPYEIWKPDNVDVPRLQLRRLFHRIVKAKNLQESNEARLRYAQIQLSQGMMPEAIAMLDGIERTNPAYFRSAKLAALRGAAYFLMYRFPEAAKDFGVAELNNSKEADYWRNMLADLLGGNSQGYDFLALNEDYISKYPPFFRQRLAIVAADRSIGSRDYNTALKIFETLHKDNLIEPISPYVNFLLAKISAETGQPKDAQDMWDTLAQDYKHPFVQARAEFSRIVWGMDHATIDKEEAIDKLERLRLAWHGDSLELSILTLLGELYFEKKDYVNAMRIWHGGVQSFPNTSESIEMTRKMQDSFITMFNDGAADNLPPLDSLALYYQYRKYAPPGIAGGELVERLASRLVSMDLLDQATYVLDQQMRAQTEKETRSRLGAKLAAIYLLNRQPKRAVSALEDSVYGENQPILRQLRNRLSAQTMVEIGQPEKALQTLGQDTTEDAERIRLDIFWKQRDWPNVINSAEMILKERKDITAQLTLEESEYVIKLALAYLFQNDSAQLKYLNDYFAPLMENNPQRDLFQYMTSGDVDPTPTNFDEVIKNLSDTRAFIKGYSARIRTDGLDSLMTN